MFDGGGRVVFTSPRSPASLPPQLSATMTGTLEKGAHHQALDLSEELPPHQHHHPQHQHQQHQQQQHQQQLEHLHLSTSLASGRDAPSRVVVPPPYSAAEGAGEAPLELRGSLDCWACSVLVTAQNVLIAAINACLAGLVFGSILTPAIAMVTFGFLCHSTVRLVGGGQFRMSGKDIKILGQRWAN